MNIIIKKIVQNNTHMSVIGTKNVYFSVDLAFKNKMRQHINSYGQPQTNINAEITNDCFWIWFADKHMRFLQSKHLQCSNQICIV